MHVTGRLEHVHEAKAGGTTIHQSSCQCQLQGKSTFTTNQEAQFKTEIEAQKAKNAELTKVIEELQEVKAKYQKFPAELRVLPEKELLEKLASAHDSDNTLTLMKAKVLTYFEGILERKKETEANFKGIHIGVDPVPID